MTTLINTKKITIGADPEFFIITNKGEAFPSTDLFRGTKDEPEDMGGEFALVKDNTLIEGNIPPSTTKEGYIKNMQTLKGMIGEVLEIAGLKLHSADSMEYKPRFLQHPEAKEFGCSAYKNAWDIGTFSAENMSRFNKRVAGAHQHIGYELTTDKATKRKMNRYIAKAFDFFVVYPARLHHNDLFREKFYGEYGNYRDCPAYGVECRSLGGFFTHDDYLPWVYDQTIKSIEFCSNEENLKLLDAVDQPKTDDTELMNKYYDILGIDLKKQLIKN